MNKYFEILPGGENRLFILQNGQRFDTRTGIPNTSLEVWKGGKFKYLGLKPEAAELFKKEKIQDLIKLMHQCRRVEDIQVLALVKPESTSLQEAATASINKLTNNSK